MFLWLLAALAPLLIWAAIRCYQGWSPGLGSVAPGVTYQVQPSATPVANSSGNVAAASAVATLPAVAGKMTYIEGFDVTGTGATAASIVTGTVTGLPSTIGTLSFNLLIPAGATTNIGTNGVFSVRFPTPLPASALNTTIVVTFGSFGTGNTNACVTAYGFQA